MIDTLADVLRGMERNPPDAEVRRQVKSAVADDGEIGELLVGCDAIAAKSGDNRFCGVSIEAIVPCSSEWLVRSTLRPLPRNAPCQKREVLLANEDAHGDWLPKSVEVDLSFASKQWQRTVLTRTDKGHRIARRHFEVCVF